MRAPSEMAAPATAPQNLIDLLLNRASQPNLPGAHVKRGDRWVDVSWGEILADVQKLSAGLLAEGLQPGERVAVFGATTLTWIVTDLAISAAGGITVPIYASNTPDECRYILQNSESSYLFVDNDAPDGKQPGRLTRIRARVGECPSLRKTIVFEGPTQGPKETPLAKLLEAGEAAHRSNPAAFTERIRKLRPEDPCCFIYTSGTTGDPKGVILTHGNWGYEATSLQKISLMEPNDSVLLFLPLAHSFAQVVKASWLGLGFKLIFAESIEKLMANMVETHPSIVPSVPRVFEKVYNGVVANGSAAPGMKGKLFRWAFKLFDEYAEAKAHGREYNSLGFALAKKLVFAKVRASLDEKLGGRIRVFISGGAPLSRKIALFFELLGFQVLEGYGLTETSAGTTVNLPHKSRVGTVGPPVPGTEIKIASDGEILIRGPGVMKGYYKNPQATAEALDPDGWFHSGDIGEVDPDGYVRITDRKKDIIVTAGGKNVSPQNLENLLKTYPIISQAMVYGDRRKYLTVLVCASEEAARKLFTDKGLPAGNYAELCQRPEIKAEVQAAVDQINKDLPPYETLKRFILADHEFTQESGELTPTLKVKRKQVTQAYKRALDSLYDEVVD
jgi:long-chain acyl-CoA synthetase